MTKHRSFLVFSLILTGLLVVACGGSSPADEPEADRVATRVAEDLAVAATLTAAVPPPEPIPTLTAAAPTEAPPPEDTPTLAAAAPKDTSPSPTLTPVPAVTDVQQPAATEAPPPDPSDTPPPPPPSPTPVLIAVLPVDGGGGDVPNIRNNHPVKDGRNVTLPGYSPGEATEPMVYRDRIVFQAEVFDANVGTNDGDGIENVTFTILDPNGNPVHERTENNAGYCVFGGGEPDCDVLSLAEYDAHWPGGAQITNGLHTVTIDINPYNGSNVVWMWSFEIALQPESARINSISIQGEGYVVDFETLGFEPQLPGQHVHFFFDTVPQGEAGVPGSGPWIVYGGTSPFTEYGVADRPANASQMCILVANPDHSIQAGSGNCRDLP